MFDSGSRGEGKNAKKRRTFLSSETTFGMGRTMAKGVLRKLWEGEHQGKSLEKKGQKNSRSTTSSTTEKTIIPAGGGPIKGPA